MAEPEDGVAVVGVDFAEQGFGSSEISMRPEPERSGVAGGFAQQLSCTARIDSLQRGGDTQAADEVIELLKVDTLHQDVFDPAAKDVDQEGSRSQFADADFASQHDHPEAALKEASLDQAGMDRSSRPMANPIDRICPRLAALLPTLFRQNLSAPSLLESPPLCDSRWHQPPPRGTPSTI